MTKRRKWSTSCHGPCTNLWHEQGEI